MTVIAISGLVCAGNSTLAHLLSTELELDYFSPGSYIKTKLGGDKTDLIANAYDKYLNNESTQEALDRLQLAIAKKGNVVIDGKLSIFILHDLTTLNVWLYADIDCRAHRLAKRYRITFDDAKLQLLKREASENRVWHKLYGIHFSEIDSYSDINFNTEFSQPKNMIREIASKLRKI